MKTTRKVETMICDQCGKNQVHDRGPVFGGHPFSGWYHLDKICGSTAIINRLTPTSWDFCSILCVAEFAEDHKIKKVTPRSSPDLFQGIYKAYSDNCNYKVLTALDGKPVCNHPNFKDTQAVILCGKKLCPRIFSKVGTRNGDQNVL